MSLSVLLFPPVRMQFGLFSVFERASASCVVTGALASGALGKRFAYERDVVIWECGQRMRTDHRQLSGRPVQLIGAGPLQLVAGVVDVESDPVFRFDYFASDRSCEVLPCDVSFHMP